MFTLDTVAIDATCSLWEGTLRACKVLINAVCPELDASDLVRGIGVGMIRGVNTYSCGYMRVGERALCK